MSLLPWWDNWYEPADLEDEDDQPVPPPELLTVSYGCGWWTNTSLLPDLDD